ncbi:MAG: PaaI family thioesterase [Clostridia bacterium]|nr:PaaI family thioesterase [Clostridia bacterium]
MSTFENLEEARAYFEGDRFAVENGMTIDALGDDWAECSLTIAPRHRNANGGVMGGAIFTLADFAFAVASNNVHRPTVGQQISINFLSGTRGARLIARARCRKDGRTTCVYNVDVVDDQGRDIAQFTGTGHKQQN